MDRIFVKELVGSIVGGGDGVGRPLVDHEQIVAVVTKGRERVVDKSIAVLIGIMMRNKYPTS